MATELKKGSNTITANGSYFWPVRPYQSVTVKIKFTTAGSAGTVALEDTQGDAYIDPDTSTAIVANFNDAEPEKHVVEPTGGHIEFTAAAFAGSPVVEVEVIQKPTTGVC
jgi:hypothetical protein